MKQKVQLQALVRLRKQGELSAQEFKRKKTVMKMCKTRQLEDSDLVSSSSFPEATGANPSSSKTRLLKCFAGGGKHIKLSSF